MIQSMKLHVQHMIYVIYHYKVMILHMQGIVVTILNCKKRETRRCYKLWEVRWSLDQAGSSPGQGPYLYRLATEYTQRCKSKKNCSTICQAQATKIVVAMILKHVQMLPNIRL